MHSLIIGEAASDDDYEKIEKLIQNSSEIVHVVEIRTQHLGPEEILIGARVAFDESLQAKEIADAINNLEATIRNEVKTAGPRFIEPEIFNES